MNFRPPREGYYEPRDEQLYPPTCLAADGKTTLRRYRVDAIIYAPTKKEARRRVALANIYLEAATIAEEGTT